MVRVDEAIGLERQRVAPRHAAVPLGIALIVAAVVGGSAGLMISYEPASVSYHLDGPPWLVNVGAGKLGAVYTKAGFSNGLDHSAVFYGVVTVDGRWVSEPMPVSPPNRPAPPGTLGPVGIAAVIDEGRQVHIAWSLWDSEQDTLSFHYLQLDPAGSVRAQTGPLASLALQEVYVPVRLGIRVTSDEIHVAFPANGTYVVSTLDLAGGVKAAPYPAPDLDNVSYFPPRQLPPGVSAMTNEPIDSDASLVSDGANTYYLWINGRQWFEGLLGRTYRAEWDLQFSKASPSGIVSSALDSTEDTWWLTKPMALPSLVFLLVAVSGTVALIWHHFRQRQWKGP